MTEQQTMCERCGSTIPAGSRCSDACIRGLMNQAERTALLEVEKRARRTVEYDYRPGYGSTELIDALAALDKIREGKQ